MYTTHETVVPFVGFYESYIGEFITEEQTPTFVAQEWVNAVSQVVFNEFGRHIFDFKELTSPKYYNFETDKIIANVEERMLAVLSVNNRETLERIAKEILEERDGFIPFYSPNVNDWGPIWDWSPAQNGLILQAFLMDTLGDDWEYELTNRTVENLHNPEWEDELE